MMLNYSLKIVLLGILLIGTEKQLLTYYSVPQKDIISNVESLTPKKPDPVKTNEVIQIAQSAESTIYSNIIMVWNTERGTKYHSFTSEEFEVLHRLSMSLPQTSFNSIMEQSKNMSTQDFVNFVKQKEQILLASAQVAKIN